MTEHCAVANATQLAGHRILFVAPRFHESILGGADRYTLALAWELQRAGAEVRVLTTRTLAFEPRAEFGIGWPDELPEGADSVSSLPVTRFGASSPSHGFAARASHEIRSSLDTEIAEAVRALGRAGFGVGWYHPERWAEDLTVRWARTRTRVSLPDRTYAGLSIRATTLARQRIRVVGVRGDARSELGGFEVRPGEWIEGTLSFDSRALDAIELEGEHGVVPGPQDARTLCIAVARLELRTADGERVDIAPGDLPAADLDAFDDEAFARVWLPIVERRPRRLERLYGLLRGPISPGLARACFREARRSDVIVASGFPFLTMPLALAAGRRARVPVLALPFFHDRDLTHHWRHLYAVLRRADATLALSRWHADQLARTYGARTVYLGASSPHWSLGETAPWDSEDVRRGGRGQAPPLRTPSGPEDRRDKRAAHHAETRSFRLVFVGRLTHSKGVATAIDAVRRLRSEGLDVRLRVVGPDESHGLDSDDAIERLGVLPAAELDRVLAESDALVLPSRHESFGLVILEAWAQGTPVLTERSSGSLRTLVADGEDGFWCSSADQYAERIRSWMEDRVRWRAMGERGRAKVAAEHRWDQVVERLASSLTTVHERSATPSTRPPKPGS